MIKEDALTRLEDRIGVEFDDRNLLIQALTHRSYLNEHPNHPTGHYERLEFLGDAVLEFIVTEHLYRNYPELPEGDLTTKRSALVEAANLTEVGRKLDIADMLLMSKGEQKDCQKPSSKSLHYILACSVEALIGAIFLEKGVGECRLFADAFILRNMTRIFETRREFKSELQEYTQSEFRETPSYKVIEASGPDHNKWYRIACVMDGKQIGIGTGRNKKEAQMNAAKDALRSLKGDEPGIASDNRPEPKVINQTRAMQPNKPVILQRRPLIKDQDMNPSPKQTVKTEENGMSPHKDQIFVESIVRELVNHPEDVWTERTTDEKGVLIVLHINPNDMSYVVGRAGRNIEAIRTLLRTMEARSGNSAVGLQVYESPEDFERHHGTPKFK